MIRFGGRIFLLGTVVFCGACVHQQTVIDPQSINLAIERQRPALTECYQSEADKHKTPPHGVVKVSFTIDQKGKPKSVSILSSDLNNEKIEQCIVRIMQQTYYPSLNEGTAEITYPFRF